MNENQDKWILLMCIFYVGCGMTECTYCILDHVYSYKCELYFWFEKKKISLHVYGGCVCALVCYSMNDKMINVTC